MQKNMHLPGKKSINSIKTSKPCQYSRPSYALTSSSFRMQTTRAKERINILKYSHRDSCTKARCPSAQTINTLMFVQSSTCPICKVSRALPWLSKTTRSSQKWNLLPTSSYCSRTAWTHSSWPIARQRSKTWRKNYMKNTIRSRARLNRESI